MKKFSLPARLVAAALLFVALPTTIMSSSCALTSSQAEIKEGSIGLPCAYRLFVLHLNNVLVYISAPCATSQTLACSQNQLMENERALHLWRGYSIRIAQQELEIYKFDANLVGGCAEEYALLTICLNFSEAVREKFNGGNFLVSYRLAWNDFLSIKDPMKRKIICDLNGIVHKFCASTANTIGHHSLAHAQSACHEALSILKPIVDCFTEYENILKSFNQSSINGVLSSSASEDLIKRCQVLQQSLKQKKFTHHLLMVDGLIALITSASKKCISVSGAF